MPGPVCAESDSPVAYAAALPDLPGHRRWDKRQYQGVMEIEASAGKVNRFERQLLRGDRNRGVIPV